MNIRDLNLPFRVGTTSYIVGEDLVANARFLAGRVQDMQLVLFDLPGGPCNLPDARTVNELRQIGHDYDLTYTVHLMDDLRLCTPAGEKSPSVERAHQVIALTRDLSPVAYVLHLDGKEFRSPGFAPAALERWQDETVEALTLVAEWAGEPFLLAVENLESYTPDFVTSVVDRLPVARCLDVGHLWLDGHDALPYLQAALPNTRVVHIHGVGERDHETLACADSKALDAVISMLLENQFAGVVTLEIFGLSDFETSMTALRESTDRWVENSQRIHADYLSENKSA